MGGMLPWGFRYSDIFNSFRHIYLFGLWKPEAPGGSCAFAAEHRRALRLVRRADVDRSAPPASSGLTADTAAPQGNELLLRFLIRRISLMHQPGPFCKLRASSALWRQVLDRLWSGALGRRP